MKKENCKVWVVNDNATVIGESKDEVVRWYEGNINSKVDVIEEGNINAHFSIILTDEETGEHVEVWKTVREGIDEYFERQDKYGIAVTSPFIVCSFGI